MSAMDSERCFSWNSLAMSVSLFSSLLLPLPVGGEPMQEYAGGLAFFSGVVCVICMGDSFRYLPVYKNILLACF